MRKIGIITLNRINSKFKKSYSSIRSILKKNIYISSNYYTSMTKKNIWVILILTILIVLNFNALADEKIYSTKAMKMNVEIDTSFELDKTAQDYYAQYFQINLSLIPLQDKIQKVENFQTTPKAKIIAEDYVLFEIQDPQLGEDSVKVTAQVTSQNQFEKISEKIDFPIKNIPEEIKIYTQPQEIIDSDTKEINIQASNIIEGETDLLEALNKIAKWIKANIDYTLDSSTEEVSQEASWVLENRYGVCDEITSLFIAMLRSVNIPARYISGVAYTNLDNLNAWGPHAWAEVYVPGYGFIPFDVTYGEFGFVDASHVVLKRSLDSAESSVEYQWKGKDMVLKQSNVEINTEVIEYYGQLEPLIELEARPIKEEIGYGSYNLIEISMKNPNNYYIYSTLHFARNDEMQIEQDMINFELLHPKSTKKMYVVVKISEDLEDNYIYTIPFYAETLRNMSAETAFTAKKIAPVYTKEEIYKLKEQIDIPEIMQKDANVEIDCSPTKNTYYDYEDVNVKCEFKNTGTIYLHNKEFCFNNECQTEDLGIGQKKEIDYKFKITKTGQNELIAVVKDEESLLKKEIITLTILDKPELVIENLDIPESVGYDESFKIVATIDKKSYSNAYDVKINFWNDKRQMSIIEKEEIDKKGIFELQLIGKDLTSTESVIKVTVDYKDENGKEYSTEKKVDVKVEGLNIIQKIVFFLKKIEMLFV
jgi:hypothetical protein